MRTCKRNFIKKSLPDIQKYYDEGHSAFDTAEHFSISYMGLHRYIKNGSLKVRSNSESQKMSKRPRSEERYSHIKNAYGSGSSFNDLIAEGYSKKEIEECLEAGLIIKRSNSESCMLAQQKYGRGILSKEAISALSIRQSTNNSGGKCKWFEVSGQKVQGTWERNIALKFDSMGLEWLKLKTGKDVWPYIIEGKIKSYTPDFYLPKFDVFLEIKGFWWGDDKNKMETVLKQHADKKIFIIEKNEYLKIMEGELVWL